MYIKKLTLAAIAVIFTCTLSANETEQSNDPIEKCESSYSACLGACDQKDDGNSEECYDKCDENYSKCLEKLDN